MEVLVFLSISKKGSFFFNMVVTDLQYSCNKNRIEIEQNLI